MRFTAILKHKHHNSTDCSWLLSCRFQQQTGTVSRTWPCWMGWSTMGILVEWGESLGCWWFLHPPEAKRKSTLPKTNKTPIKMVVSNNNLLFQASNFQGLLLLVSCFSFSSPLRGLAWDRMNLPSLLHPFAMSMMAGGRKTFQLEKMANARKNLGGSEALAFSQWKNPR